MNYIKTVLADFQIPKENYLIAPITNGYINDTFLISIETKPKYILQRVNTEVFSNIESLIKNIEYVLPHLKGENYESISLIKATNNLTHYEINNAEVWRLMTYIPNSKTFNTTTNTEVAFEAGKIISLFHKLVLKSDALQLTDTLPNFHSISFRFQQFENALAKAKPETINNAKKAILFIEKNIHFLKNLNANQLPIRICHNDTKLNNILFSENDSALCLIDLDTLMKGTFLYDFGDAIRTIVNAAPEDEKDLNSIIFNMNLFHSFVQGLSENDFNLSSKEKELLPKAVVLMPFLHGMRALTDYLENNKYYKVSYETQNLDRCFSLFAFAQLALNKQNEMKISIYKHLS